MCAVNFLITLALILPLFHATFGAHEVKGVCLTNERHKSQPGPEDDSYKGCLVFKNSSCCKSDFANQLALPVVKGVGNFSWTLCGNLSPKCQEYMVGVECFYSCSPYVGHWADPKMKQSFKNAPVCSSYCDSWYEACKDDVTCAKDWIRDFNYTSDGHNVCKKNCTTFGKMYDNGKDLCESMWGDSFKYSTSKDRCLHFRYDSSDNPNKDVVEKIFGHSGSQKVRGSLLSGLGLAILTYRFFF
jgi:folate receptor